MLLEMQKMINFEFCKYAFDYKMDPPEPPTSCHMHNHILCRGDFARTALNQVPPNMD